MTNKSLLVNVANAPCQSSTLEEIMELYFTDVFGVDESVLEKYGAFNISLLVDLPLFIDPFLLFDSEKKEYQALHGKIIDYLHYLRELSTSITLSKAGLKELYCFSEVEQNWLGFCTTGNTGRGLGMKFARALNENLNNLFRDFGDEEITEGSHLEKLCLIKEGVGRDTISDFTTNLIKSFLCDYTQTFAKKHLADTKCREFSVERASYNAKLGRWMPQKFFLPCYQGDFVILTPKDILTKDDTWINKTDFVREYHDIPNAIDNDQLRERIDSYFQSVLPRDPDAKDFTRAIQKTALQFPELFDYFIKRKEQTGDIAKQRSINKVEESFHIYVKQFGMLVELLKTQSDFYKEPLTSDEAAKEKIEFLKDVIENKGGWRIFYHDGKPIKKEEDIQILYRLVWHHTGFDVSREVNDGRGPADYKVSKGARDKTIVEMKLASNSGLARQLANQAEIYQKASDAGVAFKVVVYFTLTEKRRIEKVMDDLGIEKSKRIYLIDARNDNKPSASKADTH